MTHQKFMFDRSFDFDDPFNEEIEVIEEAEEEPETIIPTFSEKEVEIARNEGFEKGKVEALKEAAKAIENQIFDVTKVISGQLNELMTNQSLANSDIFRDSIRVSRAITGKTFPSINAEKGFQEIESLLHHVLGEVLGEPRVKIQIHPTLTEQLSKCINQISENTHFEGQVLVFANEAVEQGDCEIEWSSGGAVRNLKDIMLEIDSIINTKLAIKDAGIDPNFNSFDNNTNDSLSLPSGQNSESSANFNAQTNTKNIDQADIPATESTLTLHEQAHQTRSEFVSAPAEEQIKITQKTGVDQHLETEKQLEENVGNKEKSEK